MARVLLSLEQSGHVERVAFDRRDVSVGSQLPCDLRVALPGIRPAHLQISADAGLVRVRSLTGGVAGFIAGRPLTASWQLLPEEGRVHIDLLGEPPLSLGVRVQSAIAGGSVIEDDRAPSIDLAAAPTIVTDAEFDAPPAGLFAAPQFSPALVKPKPRKPSWARQSGWVVCGAAAVGMVGVILTLLLVKNAVATRRAADLAARVAAVDDTFSKAQTALTAGKYAQAKGLLDDARTAAAAVHHEAEYQSRFDALARRPEIRFGANGYALLDGQWQPAATAAAERAARDRDAPQLAALKSRARSALSGGDASDGRRACDDALALLAAHPLRPVPDEADFTSLRNTLQNRVVAAEMQARGMVLATTPAGEQWVTPAEKFRFDQLALGRAEYRGQWLPKDEAFAAEQKDKGLTLRDGRWMTADEIRAADGYVQFEGEWVQAARRDQILKDRAEQARIDTERAAAERQRLEQQSQQANTARPPINSSESLKTAAYLASQDYARQLLPPSAVVRFPQYRDRGRVMVVAADTWLVVRASVDAPSASGKTLRRTYFCKLRPDATGNWEVDSTFFTDGRKGPGAPNVP